MNKYLFEDKKKRSKEDKMPCLIWDQWVQLNEG